MDSMDLEREKGITILAKNTAVVWNGTARTINIVDTPGHADFGGEVERGLSMVDGVVLLVDAAEGPLPQTRFVLRKALARDMPVILVINKVDRPDARIAEVVDEVYELFLDLDATEDQLDFPIVYCSGRDGWATLDRPDRRHIADSRRPQADLFESSSSTIPAPPTRGRTAAGAGHQPRRLAVPRPPRAVPRPQRRLKKGQQVAWCKRDGTVERAKIAELFLTEALTRVPVEAAGPGDIVAIAGIEDITIGETLADPDDPIAAAGHHRRRAGAVDDHRHQHLAARRARGQEADRAAGQEPARRRTGRQRLDPRLPTERPDAWEVQGAASCSSPSSSSRCGARASS
jgi:GTP-binding protein